MALQFIFGGSGSGKSNYIYEHILKLSQQDPNQLFFVVVPEQFTMQTQRELVRRQENHCILNIDVVSFQRLAYRVFDELGLRGLTVLEETGKNFVLRKVAGEKQEELTLLKGNMKKPGYINELKSVISELGQYRIGTEQLKSLTEDESLPLPFRYRMADICTMYQGFLDYLKGNYITAEEILQVLAQEAEHSRLLRDSVLVLDGFTGFTPIQYELLERLFACARDVYVTVTLDEREDPYRLTGMQELFYMSKKTVRILSDLAARRHMELAGPVQLTHSDRGRFREARPLEWLERNLFRDQVEKYPAFGKMESGEGQGGRESSKSRDGSGEPGEGYGGSGEAERYTDPADHIFLYSLSDPRRELLFIAGEIRRLIREEGCRYKDIALVCGDVELYGNYVPEIFDSFEIPYFLDKKKSITFQPLTEMVRSLLLAVEQDFSYESVMDYLRCGLSNVSRGEADLLENYLLANQIRGFSRWRSKWVRLNGVSDTRELEAVNVLRERIAAQFEEARPILQKKDTTVLQKTRALYGMIAAQRVQEQLEERRVKLEREGRLALAREYAQIYKLVMDLLDKLARLLAEEKMELSEYRQVLEAGFAASSVGNIPPGYDQVLIGDIERTRLPDIQILFLAGVNDGLIPRADKGGGLISQKEREYFAARDMELAPGTREKAFMQRFYLYLNLTKPSRKLYLTWHRVDGEGKETRRSYLVGKLQGIFPSLSPVQAESGDGLRGLATPRSGLRLLSEGMSRAREGEASPQFLALFQWYLSHPDWSRQAMDLFRAAFYSYESHPMSREVTRALYGEALAGSVTRLERFASCAYAHFMAYGLGVKERQLGEFAPVDMGSLFHEALERYSLKMEEAGYHWQDVPKEQREAMVREATAETVEEAGYLLYQDARTAYTIRRMERILAKTVETISDQIAQSSFKPEGYEVSFSFVQDLAAVNFTLSEQEKMRLQGRIDRMDVRREEDTLYVKVVDYKSGANQFQLASLYYGLQLQLVVYLNAAVEILKRENPGREVVGAGMYYYHIDDPVIEVKGQESEEEIRARVLEQLKLAGVGCDSGDESVSPKSRQASREEVELLSRFVNQKIREIGKDIYRGNIAVSPYRMKEKTGCDYCPYHSICGFDGKVPGYSFRQLKEEKDAEVLLEQMREEVSHGDDVYAAATEGH